MKEKKMSFEFCEVVEDGLREFVYEGSDFSFSKEEELDSMEWLKYYENQEVEFIN